MTVNSAVAFVIDFTTSENTPNVKDEDDINSAIIEMLLTFF